MGEDQAHKRHNLNTTQRRNSFPQFLSRVCYTTGNGSIMDSCGDCGRDLGASHLQRGCAEPFRAQRSRARDIRRTHQRAADVMDAADKRTLPHGNGSPPRFFAAPRRTLDGRHQRRHICRVADIARPFSIKSPRQRKQLFAEELAGKGGGASCRVDWRRQLNVVERDDVETRKDVSERT